MKQGIGIKAGAELWEAYPLKWVLRLDCSIRALEAGRRGLDR
jgi:hypothetical protein